MNQPDVRHSPLSERDYLRSGKGHGRLTKAGERERERRGSARMTSRRDPAIPAVEKNPVDFPSAKINGPHPTQRTRSRNMAVERIITAGINNRGLKRNFLFLSLLRVRSAAPSYSIPPLIDSRSSFFSPILIQLSTRPRGKSIVHTRHTHTHRERGRGGDKTHIYCHRVSRCVFNTTC